MKFVRATVGVTVATVVTLVLLLNTGVFAYSGRAAAVQASPSPLDDKHGSGSAHAPAQDSNQTQSGDDQNGDQGNGNDNAGNQSGDNGGGPLHFTLYSASSVHGKADRGQAFIVINGNTLNVEISVKKTSPSTAFSVVLVAIPVSTTTTTTSTSTTFSTTIFTTTTLTSTSTSAPSCAGSIGTFMTDGDGQGEGELSTTLNSGTYALGLVLCSNNVPILVSHPTTREAVVPQGAKGNEEDSESETTSSTTTVFSTTMPSTASESEEDQGDKVNPVTESGHDGAAIRTAMSDKTIPAVISVLNSGVSFHQLDSRFSVSASKLNANGLMVSISAQNVTGSRVLLVNLTGSQWSTSSLQSLKVTFDGAPISQAASLSQVINSSSTDPARYIIMLTSSGLQLLVSIPHFSLHTIELIPTVVPTAGIASLDGALLVGALVLFAALSAAAYLKRGRIYSLLK